MTEIEFVDYCKSQLSGPFKEEDLVTMLTAWGSIKFTQGYNQAKLESSTDDNSASNE
jgi:hypothetical protein